MANGTVDWKETLLAERARTLAAFRDPRRSPYAAVARHDIPAGAPLLVGSAADDDVRLEGLAPHHARIAVDGAAFEVEIGGVKERVEPGRRIDLGRFVLRLSHQNLPAVLVLDPGSSRVQEGPLPRWFPPDEKYRLESALARDRSPREEVVLSTLGFRRRALRLGHFEARLDGLPLRLAAHRLLEPGVEESAMQIFFRDATAGRETYPVGRYLDPEPLGEGWLLDFNRAVNPTCAFSPHYSCPVPPRENVLAFPIRAGEMDPAVA